MSFFSRKSTKSTAAPAAAATTPEAAAPAVVEDISGDYTIDPTHTRLGFSARHAMVTTVRGQFTDFAGTAHVDTVDPAASKVELTIQTASIDTGVADRDGHLRSADFFDADTNKEISFSSTEVARDGSDWVITGDLTIKGVTRSISITFEPNGSARDPFGNERIGFEGATSINRKDWDLSWNAALETGGVLVSEKIKLEFDISAIKNA
ncbi:YceI family protein [Nocardioides sp. YIM 152588]|uniref:YceI family protein n=1 Tax=Nocardioides sp. YIM 152588 TaxID=3158259 RepID=UPI0032E42084